MTDHHAADRTVRTQQVAIAVTMFVLALVLPLLQQPALWPVTAVGGVISALLLWGALRDEAVAGPVVGLVITAAIAMLVGDEPSISGLAAVVVAIMLGEHLAVMQHTRYATPGHSRRTTGLQSVALHGATAAAATAVTMVATLLPDARAWSATAIAAIGIVGIVLHRRRAALDHAPLPPPEQIA